MVEPGLSQEIIFDWSNSPLFRFCESSDWELFLRATEACEKPAGSQLWSEGESGNLLICVLSGSLEAIKKTPEWGKPIIMSQFHPGATVGELVLADSGVHSTTLQVVEDAQLLICQPSEAILLFSDFPTTAARLWRGAAYLQQLRLRHANSRLATLF
ncbi:MAG: cyclic nucleotide-binding domain-containing protein [Deltaproteobacteria bacterium]|nr:cyclic nucleotide-binding domain-containing protein [Candidatus Tharpella aukensis]